MIKTSRQLKDLVHNKSGGDSAKAQVIIRNYIMERFLERVSRSKYSNQFIFKGGMMISAMVGIDNRSTMDIDTTLKNINLSVDDISDVLSEIISVEIVDGIEPSWGSQKEYSLSTVGVDDAGGPPVPIPNFLLSPVVPKIVGWRRPVKIGKCRHQIVSILIFL